MDALGHVNNVRYFDYCQQARLEWLESLKLDMLQTVFLTAETSTS